MTNSFHHSSSLSEGHISNPIPQINGLTIRLRWDSGAMQRRCVAVSEASSVSLVVRLDTVLPRSQTFTDVRCQNLFHATTFGIDSIETTEDIKCKKQLVLLYIGDTCSLKKLYINDQASEQVESLVLAFLLSVSPQTVCKSMPDQERERFSIGLKGRLWVV